MADLTLQVQGLQGLGAAMRKLGADVAGKIARQATAAGAGVVRKAARENAPKDTGALAASIVIRRVRLTHLTSEYEVTLSTKQMIKYLQGSRASIFELQGPIKPVVGKNGKVYRATKLLATKTEYEDFGDLFYGKFIEFGTVKLPARPFLRPALQDNLQPATDAIANRLRARIIKAGGAL